MYLLQTLDGPLPEADAYLIAVAGFSSRSMCEFSLGRIRGFLSQTKKEVFLLCDALLTEAERGLLQEVFPQIAALEAPILFADFAMYEAARSCHVLDRLVYYSPTMALSAEEILCWKESGVTSVILSKECEYEGYRAIVSRCGKDMTLGMLALGYPQIYFSKRKLLSSFQEAYEDVQLEKSDAFRIREATRTAKLPIYEDERGTYVFAGEVFRPGKCLKEFADLGMEIFLIDPTFCKEKRDLCPLVRADLAGEDSEAIEDPVSTFMLYRELVKNYE